MLEAAALRDQFEMLLDQEQRALGAYTDLMARIDDLTVREQVEQLLREKQRHVELTERLLEIVE